MLTTLKHRNLQAEQYESRKTACSSKRKDFSTKRERIQAGNKGIQGNVEQRNKNETKKLKEDTNFHL